MEQANIRAQMGQAGRDLIKNSFRVLELIVNSLGFAYYRNVLAGK